MHVTSTGLAASTISAEVLHIYFRLLDRDFIKKISQREIVRRNVSHINLHLLVSDMEHIVYGSVLALKHQNKETSIVPVE